VPFGVEIREITCARDFRSKSQVIGSQNHWVLPGSRERSDWIE